jgi:glycosyltransferase involved in cell wall biosynthesis
MKIAVYTIALNEQLHCERWAESVKDADYRIVLDTGSTDGTVEKLRALGVTVFEQRFDPWRFDHARNAALACLPVDTEICISQDMDEFLEVGWRPKMEAAWRIGETTRLAYTYVFDYRDGGPNDGYRMDKIHARMGYQWRRPVHETVFSTVGYENVAEDLSIILGQIQDRSKGTRSNYLTLMEMATAEDPADSQLSFWYGRELMYANKLAEAVSELNRYLDLETSKWPVERSEAMIYLSRMVDSRKLEYLQRALICSPERRQVWLELAHYYYNNQDWYGLLWTAGSGIAHSRRDHSYLDSADAWGNQLLDFGSIAAANLGWYSKATDWCQEALAMQPTDDRLKNNLQWMQSKIKETTQ